MTRGLRLGLAVATALVSVPLGGAGAVAAAGSSTGGACKTDAGVTVVVDMSAFDGPLVVRCVAGPLPSNYTGWDALADAGFDPQAPSREPGFVCRVSGEPSASRSMDIPENPDYHEQCVNTPPLSAYWGYWYATNGGSWTYSSTGAGGRRVVEGGYEGWAFSLNSGGHPPKPGIAPSHPISTPGPTHAPRTSAAGPTSAPTSSAPHTSSPNRPTTTPTGSPTTGPGDKPGQQRRQHHQNDSRHHNAGAPSSTTAPSTTDATTQAAVTGELPPSPPQPGSGSALPVVLGIGVLVLLGAGAGMTAWRRSHRG